MDVLVVGAGVAGPVLARELSREGLRVGLVDRATFPRGKVCGCCLNPSALASLGAVGLSDVAEKLGAVPLRELRWSHGRASAKISLPGGVAVSRERLDAELARRAVDAGVLFADQTSAHVEGGEVTLSRPGYRQTIRPRFVVAANGLLGASALGLCRKPRIDAKSWVGAGAILDGVDPFFTPGTIWMASGPGGYVGAVRVEGDRFDVAAALDPGLVKSSGGLAAAAESHWRRTGWPPLAFASAGWKGTPPLTRTPSRLAGSGWLAVGDATGYVEPFTGEGMAWALASARLAVPHVLAGLRGEPSTWADAFRRTIRPRQRACRVVASGLRSGWASGAAARLLGRFPALAGSIVGRLAAPARLK